MDSFKILNELFMKNLLNENHTLRYNNYLNLRAPTKNAIVTYNALQKVFRTRFDEGRSNAKLLDFSNSFSKISFISAPRSPFEKLLSKNKQKFFKVDFFKNNAFSSSNYLYDLETSLNYYYFDFPFLLAYKSDASRYL
jgi:hypothetical protein